MTHGVLTWYLDIYDIPSTSFCYVGGAGSSPRAGRLPRQWPCADFWERADRRFGKIHEDREQFTVAFIAVTTIIGGGNGSLDGRVFVGRHLVDNV